MKKLIAGILMLAGIHGMANAASLEKAVELYGNNGAVRLIPPNGECLKASGDGFVSWHDAKGVEHRTGDAGLIMTTPECTLAVFSKKGDTITGISEQITSSLKDQSALAIHFNDADSKCPVVNGNTVTWHQLDDGKKIELEIVVPMPYLFIRNAASDCSVVTFEPFIYKKENAK